MRCRPIFLIYFIIFIDIIIGLLLEDHINIMIKFNKGQPHLVLARVMNSLSSDYNLLTCFLVVN